jgi:hypothetical protein
MDRCALAAWPSGSLVLENVSNESQWWLRLYYYYYYYY